jgi:hypothetical protein
MPKQHTPEQRRDYNRRRYLAGTCQRCQNPRRTNRTTCQACYEKVTARARAVALTHCLGCGETKTEPTNLCSPCREKDNARGKKAYAVRTSRGLCRYCSDPCAKACCDVCSVRRRAKKYRVPRSAMHRVFSRDCEVCGKTAPEHKRLHIDHDHKTGLFRGMLCHACNVALGQVSDNPHTLRRLADYVEKGGKCE